MFIIIPDWPKPLNAKLGRHSCLTLKDIRSWTYLQTYYYYTVTVGRHRFYYACPATWNLLTPHMTDMLMSLFIFKKLLKKLLLFFLLLSHCLQCFTVYVVLLMSVYIFRFTNFSFFALPCTFHFIKYLLRFYAFYSLYCIILYYTGAIDTCSLKATWLVLLSHCDTFLMFFCVINSNLNALFSNNDDNTSAVCKSCNYHILWDWDVLSAECCYRHWQALIFTARQHSLLCRALY